MATTTTLTNPTQITEAARRLADRQITDSLSARDGLTLELLDARDAIREAGKILEIHGQGLNVEPIRTEIARHLVEIDDLVDALDGGESR